MWKNFEIENLKAIFLHIFSQNSCPLLKVILYTYFPNLTYQSNPKSVMVARGVVRSMYFVKGQRE